MPTSAACDDGHHVVWSDVDGGYRLYSTPTEVGTVWAIDLPEELAVFSAGSFGPIPPATQRQVREVLDSITFVASDHPSSAQPLADRTPGA